MAIADLIIGFLVFEVYIKNFSDWICISEPSVLHEIHDEEFVVGGDFISHTYTSFVDH